MSDETNQTQEEVLAEFTSKIEEFMAHSMQLNVRLNELEVAVAYLLQKDPEWVANFKAQQEAEGGSVEKRPAGGLVEPE